MNWSTEHDMLIVPAATSVENPLLPFYTIAFFLFLGVDLKKAAGVEVTLL